MHDLSLADIISGLQAGQFSSTELTQGYLARLDELDGQLNSFITVDH